MAPPCLPDPPFQVHLPEEAMKWGGTSNSRGLYVTGMQHSHGPVVTVGSSPPPSLMERDLISGSVCKDGGVSRKEQEIDLCSAVILSIAPNPL